MHFVLVRFLWVTSDIYYLPEKIDLKKKEKKGKAQMKYKSDNLCYSSGLRWVRGPSRICETMSEKAIICPITVLRTVVSFSVLWEKV